MPVICRDPAPVRHCHPVGGRDPAAALAIPSVRFLPRLFLTCAAGDLGTYPSPAGSCDLDVPVGRVRRPQGLAGFPLTPSTTSGTTTMEATTFNVPAHATIRPWIDPVVDEHGHDPRSSYVEQFWLGVIGPTATWIMRRLAAGFDTEPSGFTIDLEHTASAMGLSFAKGAHSPFGKALQRCVMFGLAHPLSDGLAVRRRFPPIALRHLRKCPDDIRPPHADWIATWCASSPRSRNGHLIDDGVPATRRLRQRGRAPSLLAAVRLQAS